MANQQRKALTSLTSRAGVKNTVLCENSKNVTLNAKSVINNEASSRQTRGALKRKADTIVDNKAKKRTAFGDITNAIGKSTKGLTAKITKKAEAKSQTSELIEKTKVESSEIGCDAALRAEAVAKAKTEVKHDIKEESCVSPSGTTADGSVYTTPAQSTSLDEKESGPPSGVEDFDKENLRDPFCVAEYATDIFINMKKREEAFKVAPYLEQQTDLSKSMRVILVDWMVEVQESFELNHETLYTAVKMVDLFLAKVRVQRDNLQLVGATATLIAAKFEERCPPAVDDFLYICDDAYSRRELLRMEINMIKAVGFDIGFPLSYSFLRRYARCAKLDMETLTLARYVLESSLMEYELVTESESLLAAGSLLLALRMKKISGWTPTLEYYTGYKLDDIRGVAQNLLEMLKQPVKDSIKTIRSKYSHKIFFEVALTPAPPTLDL